MNVWQVASSGCGQDKTKYLYGERAKPSDLFSRHEILSLFSLNVSLKYFLSYTWLELGFYVLCISIIASLIHGTTMENFENKCYSEQRLRA